MSATASSGFAPMAQAVLRHHGLDEQALRRPGPDGSGTITVPVPVTGGKGSYTSPKETTFWQTISGSFTIQSPSGGSWSVVVQDVEAGKTVFSGKDLVQGRAYSFGPYTTGFSTELQVSVTWSESGSTTLQALINYSY